MKRVFEDNFFDKRASTNYRVFRYLKALQDSSFTINRLAHESKLSYSQTYNAFQDIMVALQLMQHRAIADLNEADFRAVGGGVSVDTYRYHLLADTVAFRFFDQLFRSGGFDVHAFCQQEGISLPTLRRKIAPFKTYMAQCGVTMNAVTWALEGSELRVRLLLLTFYQLAFRGVGWPFGTRRFQQAKADFTAICTADPTWFAPGRATKLDLMVLAVQAMRLDNGHALAPNKRWQGVVADAGMTLAPLI
ncbi:helix-turn-helix domain-containing protein [Lacticaseibacillus suihuaensis]